MANRVILRTVPMSFLRSLLISTPLIVLATVFMGTLSLFASLIDGTGRTQHHLARIWGKMLLTASFIRVRVEGLEKLDPKGSYVFVSNHASYMDIPAILSRLPQQFFFFAKKGLFSIPFMGTHLKRAGHLPVDRSNARNSLKSMRIYDSPADPAWRSGVYDLLYRTDPRSRHRRGHDRIVGGLRRYCRCPARTPAYPSILTGAD